MAPIEAILRRRRAAMGEAGCPGAMVTDSVLRDHNAVWEVVFKVFPLVLADPSRRPVLCQDIIHSEWSFTRVLSKHHPDCAVATKDIKDIFGRFT